jgi:hypothetical protein
MKQLLLPTLAAILFLPVGLPAQAHSATVPPELQESWTRFSTAWSRADLASLAPQLTADFVLLAPAGEYRGHAQMESDWPRARRHGGRFYRPTSFAMEGATIAEMGRGYAPFSASPRQLPTDGYECAPDEEVDELQPVRYRREWMRALDGSWQVRSIVLH